MSEAAAMADFIHVVPGALDAASCAAIVQRLRGSDALQAGRIGSGVFPELKHSRDLGISGKPEWAEVEQRLNGVVFAGLLAYLRQYPQALISPLMLQTAGADGAAEFLSQQYLDYVGLSLEETQGGGWASTLHPDDAAHLVGAWQRMMESRSGGDVEARVRRFDGEYRWFLFRANPIHDEAGNVIRWFGVNTDIEDRKRAEQALRAGEAALAASELHLRQIINTIPAVVC